MKEEKITITNAQELRQEKCNVPTLRFKQFQDNWSSKRLSDIAEVVGGGTPDTTDSTLWNGDIQWFTPTEVGHSKYVSTSIRTISQLGLQKSSAKILPSGSILLSSRATVGECSIAQKDCTTNQGFQSLIPKKSVNNEFLYYLAQTQKRHFIKYASGSTFLEISNSEIKKTKCAVPSIEEQTEIATFLSAIDRKIEVQNKIISKYETLIKGIREQVVNGGWQWKKLDELIQKGIVRLNRGNIIPKHQKDNIYKYPVYSSSTQNNGLMGYNDTYMFDKELITWSIDGGGNFFYRKKHKFNVTNVCGIMQVDENIYSYRFIAEMLTYQHSKMKFDYQSKAHPSVISSLYSLPCLPISEQNSYCRLFIALDRKIQIEQQSLCKLKEQKKYLLSKMFI